MIFNASGGGGGLNFRVVGGTTQPSNPKENTIWVETGTTIHQWFFQPSAPSSPSTGDVWILTGFNSAKAFNALKKNVLIVNPGVVAIYNGTAWESVDAQIYQNGTWTSLIDYLYAFGDQYTELTGGWAQFNGGAAINDTPSFGTDSITIAFSRNKGTSHHDCYAATNNAVQIPVGASMLKAEITSMTSTNAYIGLFVGTNLTAPVAMGRANYVGEVSVDVSSLAGTSYRIVIGASSRTDNGLVDVDGQTIINATIERIWFE